MGVGGKWTKSDGSGRYRRTKPKPILPPTDSVNWNEIDYIVGTRDDVTHTGINRPCNRCGLDVYTSRHYPRHVPMICEVCALEMVEEEQREAKNDGGDGITTRGRRQ